MTSLSAQYKGILREGTFREPQGHGSEGQGVVSVGTDHHQKVADVRNARWRGHARIARHARSLLAESARNSCDVRLGQVVH